MSDDWKLYKELCASLREDGISTDCMYVAYLRGALRKARQRITKLEKGQTQVKK